MVVDEIMRKSKIIVVTLILSGLLIFNCTGAYKTSAAQTFQKISDINTPNNMPITCNTNTSKMFPSINVRKASNILIISSLK